MAFFERQRGRENRRAHDPKETKKYRHYLDFRKVRITVVSLSLTRSQKGFPASSKTTQFGETVDNLVLSGKTTARCQKHCNIVLLYILLNRKGYWNITMKMLADNWLILLYHFYPIVRLPLLEVGVVSHPLLRGGRHPTGESVLLGLALRH